MSSAIRVENTLPALFKFSLKAIKEENYGHALEALQAALRLEPNNPELHHLISHVYKYLGDAQSARTMLQRAISLRPNEPQYHYNAGVVASEEGQNNRAMAHYEQALRLSPDMPDALWNYGELLRMDEHFDLALACFERLVAMNQIDYKGLWHRMAVCCASRNRFEEAEALFQRALAESDCDKLTHWEYALFRLSLEDFKTGFKFYNDRFLCGGRNSVFCHDFPYPLWNGKFTQGQTLLVHGEQGLGDELMFASTFNELLDDAEKSNATVIVACKSPVARLMSHSFPRVQVRVHMTSESPVNLSDVQVDAQLPMGHLMSLYRHTETDFEVHRGAYFIASSDRVAHYAQRIQELGREAVDGKRRFRVGLMWGSNPTAYTEKFRRWSSQRSIPLNMLTPFADLLDDVEFISLQNFERGAEVAFAPQLKIIDFSQDQADFYDTAGLIENLDLVISVCTSVSHLAGGLAKETWVPLMKRADWRHARARSNSLWYKDTTLFRQTQANDWHGVVVQLHKALRDRVQLWKKSV